MATEKPRKSRKSKERILEQVKVIDKDIDGYSYVSSHITKVRLPSEPPFVKLYIDDLSKLLNIKEAPKKLLLSLIPKLDYEGYISITPFDRERIAERLGITKQTFANYIQKLIKANIIKNIGRGSFQVNPNLFAKGDWAQILQQREAYKSGLELRVTYDGNFRKIQAVSRSEQPRLPFEDPQTPFDEATIFSSEEEKRQHYKDFPTENPRTKYNRSGTAFQDYRDEILLHKSKLNAAE